MDDRSRVAVVNQFRILADRIREAPARSETLGHIDSHLWEYDIQGAKLVLQCIDERAFTKGNRKKNGDWWDRKQGRIPGGPLTFYRPVPQALMHELHRKSGGETTIFKINNKKEAVVKAWKEYRRDVQGAFSEEQLIRLWRYTVSAWLVPSFPTRVRHNGGQLDWPQVARDRSGRALTRRECGLDPCPDDPRGLDAFVAVAELYKDPDWWNHFRTQAEVHADTCVLLAELLEAGASVPIPKRSPNLPTRIVDRKEAATWFRVEKRTLDKWIVEGAVAARMLSLHCWIFDLADVEQCGGPSARAAADPATRHPT